MAEPREEDAVLCARLRDEEPSAGLMKQAAARIETLSVLLASASAKTRREEAPKQAPQKAAPKKKETSNG